MFMNIMLIKTCKRSLKNWLIVSSTHVQNLIMLRGTGIDCLDRQIPLILYCFRESDRNQLQHKSSIQYYSYDFSYEPQP